MPRHYIKNTLTNNTQDMSFRVSEEGFFGFFAYAQNDIVWALNDIAVTLSNIPGLNDNLVILI